MKSVIPNHAAWIRAMGVCRFTVGAIWCWVMLSSSPAGQFDLPNPAGPDAEFGAAVAVLPNGNIVVTAPGHDGSGTQNIGAVYLFDGATLEIISTLTGSTEDERVGGGGITVLANGNFVLSTIIETATTLRGLGAVTWGSATSGVSGAVSEDNSLIPGSVGFGWADESEVIALPNGHYLVHRPGIHIFQTVYPGALTWGDGTIGVTGRVSTANSLIIEEEYALTIGKDNRVTVLANGHYVLSTPLWNQMRGAVTWGNGDQGVRGMISGANSLVGSTNGDKVGFDVTALANGHYVVSSPHWSDGADTEVGAVTWLDGSGSSTGVVTTANSLVGSTAMDRVGEGGVTALANGHYVVSSRFWDHGARRNAGAVTWGNGMGGVAGPVTAVNSLVGNITDDFVGHGQVTPLSDGDYVVCSPYWNLDATTDRVGAATWCDGDTGRTRAVSKENSLIGTEADDRVGGGGAIALANGKYVVLSPDWNGRSADLGAATWAGGREGITGEVSDSNSLVGRTAQDRIGEPRALALANGNYVVISSGWDSPSATDAGAVTWGSGSAGVVGPVSAANSLVGSRANDAVGSGGSRDLANGNYVVASPLWDNTSIADAGAVTWIDGSTSITGEIHPANSLVGGTAGDQVGTFLSTFSNSQYAVVSTNWDNLAETDIGEGAVGLGDGEGGLTGLVSTANSVLGRQQGSAAIAVFDYDAPRGRLVVGLPNENRVTIIGIQPAIGIEQPVGVELGQGATTIFGTPAGTADFRTFTVRNTGLGDLTGLGITINGPDASLFSVTDPPDSTVSGPLGNTTFTVRFAPITAGTKSADLHIASNDPDKNPFDIHLTGRTLSETEDSDGDGLNDATEFHLASLGFDWQVSQPQMVIDYYTHASGAGLYTTGQVHALHAGIVLIQPDPLTDLFTLTIGVDKTTNLLENYVPFPMTTPQTTINAQGELEFVFPPQDGAAFYRLGLE